MTIKEDKIVKYNQLVREAKENRFETDILKFCVVWADIMEEKIAKGAILEDIAKDSEMECYDVDPTIDITGAMYSVCVSVLSDYWIFGEVLRNWHNKKHGYHGNGVVNSSVITVSI